MTETSRIQTQASVANNAQVVRPEFIRLPRPGTRDPATGLSRSKLNELILPSHINEYRPPVRSISLRKRGQSKAVRLINYDSLLSHLRSLEEGQAVQS